MLKRLLRLSFLCILLSVVCAYGVPHTYVLTGGPGVGKTTLLLALHKHNFAIVPESATMIIENALSRGLPNPACSGGPEGIGQFQENVWRNQLRLEEVVAHEQYAFLDRSIVDGLAYIDYNKTFIHPDMIPTIQTHRYNLVFVLAPFTQTANTAVRAEGHEKALKLHQMICEKYVQFGYQLIFVPAFSCESEEQSVALRVDFVLRKVSEYEAQRQIDAMHFLN